MDSLRQIRKASGHLRSHNPLSHSRAQQDKPFYILCFTVGQEVSVSVIVLKKAVGEEEGMNLHKCRGP